MYRHSGTAVDTPHQPISTSPRCGEWGCHPAIKLVVDIAGVMAADGSHLDVEGLAWRQGSVQQKHESCSGLVVMIQAEFSLQVVGMRLGGRQR